MIEMVSVLAAEMRIKKPVEVKRPAHLQRQQARAETGLSGTKHAVAVLRNAQARRARRAA
ncbi:hypothetical protein AB0395_21735 [Streptosporangium sp. NPDC051023]|uniref:hypothetical protein n=1 Tax=Streptosporangium sp. NPDC051023 TaxID=3155410 RepID=UPI00344C47DF